MVAKRPRGLPATARWNDKLQRWEAGTQRNGRSIGTWKFWDADGTLRTERTWDDAGKPDGRLASYHPDGTLAYEHLSNHGKMLRVAHYAARTGKNRFDPRLPIKVVASIVKAEYVPAKHGWEWRLYDRADNRVDAGGEPLAESRATDAQIRALVKRPPAGETFEQAIARANRWFEQLLALRGKEVQMAWGRKTAAVRIVGKPATRAQVAKLERWTGALPPSYRRFLLTHGAIAFIDRIATEPIATLRTASERYTEHSFATGKPWTKARPGVAVGFTAKELADPPFLVIAAGDLLVLHARDRSREAPVVRHHADDGTTDLYFIGRSFDAWVSRRVDELIEELTHQFA